MGESGRPWALGWALVLLIGGCSAGGPPVGPAPGSAAVSSPVASPVPSAAVARPTASLTAADGTDLEACADADCQVLIGGQAEVRPVPSIGVDGVILTYRGPDSFSIGAGRGSYYVDCDLTGTGYLSMAWGVTVTVEGYTPGGAIVRITPESEGDDAHRGSGTEAFSLHSN